MSMVTTFHTVVVPYALQDLSFSDLFFAYSEITAVASPGSICPIKAW